MVGENSRSTCMAYVNQSEAGLELEAPCVTTNAAGEKLFLLPRRTVGGIEAGQGGGGRAQLLGGTGKFAGITGSCSYETECLEDNWLVTITECELLWEKRARNSPLIRIGSVGTLDAEQPLDSLHKALPSRVVKLDEPRHFFGHTAQQVIVA